MTIKWFTSSRSLDSVTVSDLESFRILFTSKPKGIRFNAAITKRVMAMNMQYLRIGIGETQMVIRPVGEEEREGAFKLIVNKATSGQVCSASIGDWAADHNLLKNRLRGSWNEELKAFVFEFSQINAE